MKLQKLGKIIYPVKISPAVKVVFRCFMKKVSLFPHRVEGGGWRLLQSKTEQ
jgi:hypothetical protein